MFCSIELYGTFGSQFRSFNLWVRENPLVWSKGKSTGAFLGLDYMNSYELILFARKEGKDTKAKPLNEPHNDIFDFPTIHPAHKVHPFEKPQELLQYLIRQSSFQHHLILDPFAGSGSTLLAATHLERSSIGFEIDEDRFLSAQARLIGAEKTSQGEKP